MTSLLANGTVYSEKSASILFLPYILGMNSKKKKENQSLRCLDLLSPPVSFIHIW